MKPGVYHEDITLAGDNDEVITLCNNLSSAGEFTIDLNEIEVGQAVYVEKEGIDKDFTLRVASIDYKTGMIVCCPAQVNPIIQLERTATFHISDLRDVEKYNKHLFAHAVLIVRARMGALLTDEGGFEIPQA